MQGNCLHLCAIAWFQPTLIFEAEVSQSEQVSSPYSCSPRAVFPYWRGYIAPPEALQDMYRGHRVQMELMDIYPGDKGHYRDGVGGGGTQEGNKVRRGTAGKRLRECSGRFFFKVSASIKCSLLIGLKRIKWRD